MNFTDFINKANKIHNNKYDYSKVEYINNKTKVKIICPEHGVFEQAPSNHFNSYGCNICGHLKSGDKTRNSISHFLNKAKEVHGDKYDYSLVKYKNNRGMVKIICPEHGMFEQKAGGHLSGKGCLKCGFEATARLNTLNNFNFLNKAKEVHGDKYDYSLVDYTSSKDKVKIICPEHGVFEQTPSNHNNGFLCSKCRGQKSKPEIEIAEFIESFGFEVKRNVRGLFENSRFEADILIESKKIVIEYNGNIWHSEKFAKHKYNIKNKTVMANEAGYKCIHIRDDQYMNNPDLMKSLIKSAFGIFENKIGARKTEKRDITLSEYNDLCKDHLQGYRSAKHKKGLYYNDVLVAAISYNSSGELIRYIVKNGWQVIGALPKLLKNEAVTFSYCDLSFFDGKSYLKAGFKLDCITKPNYRYVKGSNIVSRQSMMKHKLAKKLDSFDKDLTEVQNCANNSWYRLFDAGNAKYVINQEQ